MSKKRLFVTCLLLGSLVAPLFAQNQDIKKRDVYTKTFPIERIYVCRYGYMVAYRNSTYDLMELYIGNKQFSGTTGKAVIVFGKGPEYPYLSATWIEGRLDHVVIYAVDSLSGTYVLHGTDDELKGRFPDQLEIKF
ncbi:MAG: hypothetical protein JXD23_16410 [Spirochaetales bacterium]|nr:hypothetical protein [Spirochaetales bacterium]